MTKRPEGPALDVERILETLSRHHVDYLVLGGTAAHAYGAERVTVDFDCLPERSPDNWPGWPRPCASSTPGSG